MNLTTAVERISHLIPTYRSPNLVGDGVWVLSPPSELPERFRTSQEERTAVYLSTHLTPLQRRTQPDHALRYLVRSYGVPIAWVTLDGRTHFSTLSELARNMEHWSPARARAVIRHQRAVRAVWPDRFAHNDEDGEVSSRPAV